MNTPHTLSNSGWIQNTGIMARNITPSDFHLLFDRGFKIVMPEQILWTQNIKTPL